MNEFETAAWWARNRAAGPQPTEPGRPAPAGTRRLVEADASAVWLLPNLPDGARPTVLDELGLPAPALEHPNDTARVLACCLRCCWIEPAGPVWPGTGARWEQVHSVFRAITDHRDEAAGTRAVTAGVRRLAATGWLRWDEATRTVRLGPRVATWSEPEVSTLRELWRAMPAPEEDPTAAGGPDAPAAGGPDGGGAG